MLVFDNDYKISNWNKSCELIFGISKEEVLTSGFNVFDLIDEDHSGSVRRVIKKLVEGDESESVVELMATDKQGNIKHLVWYNSIFRDSNGKVKSILTLVQDETTRINHQLELKQSQDELKTIFDTTHDVMVVVDKNDNDEYFYSSVNKAFLKLSGLEETAVIGKKLNSIFEIQTPDELTKTIKQVFETKELSRVVERLKVRDIDHWFELTIKPINFSIEKKWYVLIVASDVTENYKTQKSLEHTLELTQKQNERLVNFAYIVSHNLRTHSSNISGIIELLKIEDDDAIRQKLFDHLKTVSGSLDQTMYHLNEVVNIHTNSKVATEELLLKPVIENTISLLREKVEGENATIINKVTDDVSVTFNPSYLESVILNFLSNALKYRSSETSPIVKLSTHEEGDFTVLEIEDNGIGIDLNKHGDQLFGLYKRFSSHTEGKGLGLYITKNQVEAMGGKIEVESEPGKGTTFRVYFFNEL
jgi:PAS domain S-box-containing protein